MSENQVKAYEVVPKKMINIMAGVIAVVCLFLIYCIVIVLSEIKEPGVVCIPFDWKFTMNQEAKVLFLVIITGALGSIVHLISSFVKYVGVKSFEKSWIIWYILRPFVGMGIAIIFYFTLRGGFLSAGTGSEDLNIYGVLTISALSGMFSKQATEKLNELFNNLFKTDEKEDESEDISKVSGPEPVDKTEE